MNENKNTSAVQATSSASPLEKLNAMLFTLRQLSQADPQSPQAIELYRLFTEARFHLEAVQLQYKRLLGMDVEALERDHVARGGRLWRDLDNGGSDGETTARHSHDGHDCSRSHKLLPQLELLSTDAGKKYLAIPLADEAVGEDRGGSHE